MKQGPCQVVMAFMDWATHVLQWLLQRVANTRVQANPARWFLNRLQK